MTIDLKQKQADINGIRLVYFESTAVERTTPTLLFVHGVACHARCWDATLRHLHADCRVVCMELRGHGRSEKRSPYRWDHFGKDLCSLIQTLDLSSIVGIGHSMGAHLLLQAASVLTRRFEALILLDPGVFHPRSYANPTKLFDSPEQHPFAKRRNEWDSASHWFETIRHRSPFDVWDPEVLRDHCNYGLERSPSGRFQLLCPPLVEAEAALNCNDTDIHPMLASVTVPAVVVRAKVASGLRHPLDGLYSYTWPGLADNLPKGEDIYRPDLTHYIPMQRPDLVATEVANFL